ncbi:MAG: hypothetical protein NTY98_25960 [Verrucomicrobia bacterium]|nr:hypothetical protein [Verrucomicrobiota bacterium]
MTFESFSEALEYYNRGYINRPWLFAVTYGFAASGSIDDLLVGFPPDLQNDFVDSCSNPPPGREKWIIVESSCRTPGTEEQEAAYYKQLKERDDRSYQGYCRLHEYFHGGRAV